MSHEIRRKIITIIGENEFTSFTQLKNELKVSTGTIYHHLETLSGLIEQKEDKKYYLKDLGLYAYNSLKDNIETINTPQREFKSPILRKMMRITAKRFIVFNKRDRIITILLSIGIIVLGLILCNLSGFTSILLFFVDLSSENTSLFYKTLSNLSFMLNFFFFFIIIEGVTRFFYNKKENTINLLTSFGIIQFPMIIYLILHFVFETSGLIILSSINLVDNILMIVFQVWSLWLLSYSLSVKKGLKIESSLIFALLLHYSGFTIILLTFL
ncbi:MAG: winged helix-turn-helix domain-containing protein [Promethearchaeota archaeon]